MTDLDIVADELNAALVGLRQAVADLVRRQSPTFVRAVASRTYALRDMLRSHRLDGLSLVALADLDALRIFLDRLLQTPPSDNADRTLQRAVQALRAELSH